MNGTSWLHPVVAALDGRETSVPVFFRDDDAGWDNDALDALIAVFATSGVGVDLAVIPATLNPPLTARLARHHRDGHVGLHQHGFRHVNHENVGRKCEFGPTRGIAEQHADLAAGQRRLRDALGDAIDPIFTPPWNRCTGETAVALATLGFVALSRDRTAPPLPGSALTELTVNVDWAGATRGIRWTRNELGQRLADATGLGVPVGVMFHHAVMDDDDLTALRDLLTVLATHRAAQNLFMRSLPGSSFPMSS